MDGIEGGNGVVSSGSCREDRFDGISGSSWRMDPAMKYSSSKPNVGESGRMIGSGNVKDQRLLSRGSSKLTFFLPLERVSVCCILDLRDNDPVGVMAPFSGVHARDDTDPDGECKLGSEEATE